MTNELEKQFFQCFGIEARQKCAKPLLKNTGGFCKAYKNCVGCDYNDLKYPQILDRILLELLVIMTRYTDIIDGFDNVQELKEFVLKELIYSLTQQECDIVKHQVRTLFEEV